jgi:hypothetical protein
MKPFNERNEAEQTLILALEEFFIYSQVSRINFVNACFFLGNKYKNLNKVK